MKRQCNNRLLIDANIHALATGVPRNNYLLNSVVYRANQLWGTLTFDL